mgnify:CR=1 FL=1
MKKMIYSPSIFWLVLSCAYLPVCALTFYIICSDFILLPPSPQLIDWIELGLSPIIILVILMSALGAIITFDFRCRPVSLTENEISRGFIFRRRIKKEDITGIGIALIYGTEAAETVYNNHKYGVYVCIGQYDESLIKKMGIWETLIRSDLIKVLSKCRSLLKKNGTGIASFDEQAYPNTIFFLGEDLDSYTVIKAWMSEA